MGGAGEWGVTKITQCLYSMLLLNACPAVQLGVPVVRAWLLDGGKLEALSLSHNTAPVHPSLMMVHYNGQYYLQPIDGFWGIVGQGGVSRGSEEGLQKAITTTGSQEEVYGEVRKSVVGGYGKLSPSPSTGVHEAILPH